MQEITIFTDGSSLGNPGPGGWGSVVWFRTSHEIVELGGHEEKTTNNRMEMMALIEALTFIDSKNLEEVAIDIYADSQYVINGSTKWIYGWKENGWMTANKVSVLNKDLWQKIALLLKDKDIEWHYVEGHAGIAGNERVDVIATSFASKQAVSLFNGKSNDYDVDLKNLKPVYSLATKKSGGKVYSYISQVDGEIKTHKSWKECEDRVKGKSAKFKKTFSKVNEEEIIKSWLNER